MRSWDAVVRSRTACAVLMTTHHLGHELRLKVKGSSLNRTSAERTGTCSVIKPSALSALVHELGFRFYSSGTV